MEKMNQFLMEQNKELTEQNKRLFAQNEELLHQVRHLTEQVQYMNKKLFGSSSEKTKVDDNQISLWEDSFFEVAEETDTQTVEDITYRRKKKKGKKAELLRNLSIEEVHCELHDKDCLCQHCGETMKSIGKKEVRSDLKYVPARLIRKVYFSYAYACNCHNEATEAKNIRCAEVPKAVIRGSFVGASLLAEVIHKKFVLSVPFYRQVGDW
ncbi:MAG: IS66 family transposase zinc-finger binding domain-containing protein, partial [Turicibacter sp.]